MNFTCYFYIKTESDNPLKMMEVMEIILSMMRRLLMVKRQFYLY